MLVVRRVEVGEVELAELVRRGECDRVAADRSALSGEERGDAEGERLQRAGRPLLEEGHLQTGGRVDPVGGLQQAGQQDRPERAPRVVRFDRVADRVDACSVLGPEVTRILTERSRSRIRDGPRAR